MPVARSPTTNLVGWVEPLRNPPAESPEMVGFAKSSTHPTDGVTTRRQSPRAHALFRPALSSPSCKNISVFQKLKQGYMIRIPSHSEGRFAIVTDAGWGAV